MYSCLPNRCLSTEPLATTPRAGKPGIFGFLPAAAALAVILTTATPVHAYCPPNTKCQFEEVAVQTSTSGCNTMNGGALSFETLTPGSGLSQTLRACYCATNAYFAGVDNTGVLFLNSSIGGNNSQDFTIIDSGVVSNGVQTTQAAGGGGCNGITFTNYAGCPGNPSQYCYADITFSPAEVGTPLTANILFGTECPNLNSSECLYAFAEALFDYYGNPVVLRGDGAGFSIISPANGTAIPMSIPTSTADPGSVSITFQAQVPAADSASTITWMNTLQYRTSGNIKVKTLTDKFATTGTGSVTRTSGDAAAYTGAGGFWTTVATLQSGADCHAVPVTGNNPPACAISSELNSLYSSTTSPSLLPKLAVTESSYQQFVQRYLMQPKSRCSLKSAVYGWWPNESMPKGAFIGLMQDSIKTDNVAWNWIANAQNGATIFKGTLKTAAHYSRNTTNSGKYPGLTPLAGAALEDVGLGLYKGFGDTWYLTPQCSSNSNLTKGTCSPGSWQWFQNLNPCIGGGTTCSATKNVVIQVSKVINSTDPCQN